MIAVGALDDPYSNSMGWSDIGQGLGAALRQALANISHAEVRSEPALAAEVQRAIAGNNDELADRLKRIAQRNPDVRHVVNGRIVEFRHQSVRPMHTSQRGGSHSRSEAVVILQINVVDLARRRVAMDQRLEARVWAGQATLDRMYRGVSLGTHRFWETPLGLASKDAIGQAASRIVSVAPSEPQRPIRIVKRISDRRVRLASDARSMAKAGELLDVCMYDSGGVNLRPVKDPDTGHALQARMESRGLYPSAWLLGRPPAGVSLEQAVLRAAEPSQTFSVRQ